MYLGQRIRKQRRELKISQQELAGQVDLAASYLSQIERGQITPSIETLRKISEALDTPLSDLLVEVGTKSTVVRRGKRLKLTLPGSGVVFELLSSDLKQPMDVFLVELHPADGDISALLPWHISELTIYVLQGKLDITLGENNYSLGRGDSLYFEGVLLRCLAAQGDERLRFICAMTPSVF